MNKKPISLILLSFSFILMPGFSLFFNAFLTGLSPVEYANLYWQQETWLVKTEFFLFSPLIGALIFRMTSWSYVAALAIIFWQVFSNIWVGIYEYNSSPLVLVSSNVYLLTSFVYLMTSNVRRVFCDKSLQWWLVKPRYATHIQNIILNNHVIEEALISNISEGGCLLKTSEVKDIGEKFKLGFSLGTYSFFREAEVVHKNGDVLGLKFLNESNEALKMALMNGNLPRKISSNPTERPHLSA